MKEKKLTVIGDVDPVDIVEKVQKHWPNVDIISVSPMKEEKKAPPPETKPKEKSENFKDVVRYLFKEIDFRIENCGLQSSALLLIISVMTIPATINNKGVDVVVLVAIVILVGLFSLQRYGADRVGWFFALVVLL
ncbi:heavy metal-associated isoprenylated plant protein 3-like [Cucumis melo var. makuwa]|uniref:Heavy metal-associated isoprenylated plant protein 3-like n=1 Tax=Cucumis melo var. makuwa TaxID=1194695 RepID=A0A5D3DXG1_CUCMM|nr:heavy metal-associated isoprenylated plant protein 3-like [Cucumis melo var. makuwa]